LLLARTLGKTLAELQAGITAEEFGLWKAEYALRPWGEYRADLRAGIVASAVANKGLTEPVYVPLDFMPFQKKKKAEEQHQEESPQETMRKMLKNHG